ncbi:hypothetical protein ACFPYJ_03400 [Paenibacillus solisilvae]|uniref:Uncharacterized protein n=1 Tax=Paenibacillus solisilvae TaxID=2486751 RepID=A0ABW0VTQ0_9BACL
MKGGFTDNYYYQTRPIPAAFGQVKSNEELEVWNAVGPEYRDTLGDTVHRDSPSFAGKFNYTNTAEANDMEYAKVSSDKKNRFFYVRTKEPITAPEGTNWMNLIINADQDDATGWEGHDYIINRSRNNGKLSIERSTNNDWTWETAGQAEYKVIGNALSVTVPKNLLPLSSAPGFDFKWADNSVAEGDIMQFLDQGDAAQNGRFNYRYTTYGGIMVFASQEQIDPALLEEISLKLKARSPGKSQKPDGYSRSYWPIHPVHSGLWRSIKLLKQLLFILRHNRQHAAPAVHD